MRKFGMIATILGTALIGAALIFRSAYSSGTWLWLPGALMIARGIALMIGRRGALGAPAGADDPAPPPGLETARLLDNFEQRFAELKKRDASPAVLSDLYNLGAQLE